MLPPKLRMRRSQAMEKSEYYHSSTSGDVDMKIKHSVLSSVVRSIECKVCMFVCGDIEQQIIDRVVVVVVIMCTLASNYIYFVYIFSLELSTQSPRDCCSVPRPSVRPPAPHPTLSMTSENCCCLLSVLALFMALDVHGLVGSCAELRSRYFFW